MDLETNLKNGVITKLSKRKLDKKISIEKNKQAEK
jgi:hypothetical protein